MKYRSILIRFLKGAVSGAISAMAMVTLAQPSLWTDFKEIFASLAMAGMFGAITGLLLALEKWSSWEELPPL